jgi:hemerythrin-like domain-containing protein
MLVQLGSRRDSLDVFDLLLDCHAKIRRFIAIASQLATTRSTNTDDIRSAAGGIVRYFSQAFPLHVADENELVLPRLVGRAAAVDDALERMRSDHADHAALIAELTTLCTTVRDAPTRPGPALAGVVRELDALIEPHLVLEETTIFPALRLLDEEERQTIMTAMRARRNL